MGQYQQLCSTLLTDTSWPIHWPSKTKNSCHQLYLYVLYHNLGHTSTQVTWMGDTNVQGIVPHVLVEEGDASNSKYGGIGTYGCRMKEGTPPAKHAKEGAPSY